VEYSEKTYEDIEALSLLASELSSRPIQTSPEIHAYYDGIFKQMESIKTEMKDRTLEFYRTKEIN
jgi:hypothetical protein